MKRSLLNANLLKKYHQELVYNYSEYPTKDNWSYDFKSEEYKKPNSGELNYFKQLSI